MARVVEQAQWVIVAHRESAHYTGSTWLVQRPADGSPPVRRSLPCPVCGQPLTYTVHSVAATRRRRTLRWAAAATVFTIPLAVIVLFALGSPPAHGAAVAALALGLAYLLGYAAQGEIGITGHGSGWPYHPRHAVLPTNPLP